MSDHHLGDTEDPPPAEHRGSSAEAETQPRSRRHWLKLIVLALVLGAAAALFLLFRGSLTLDNLAAREGQLREYYQNHPGLVLSLAFLIYVSVTGLSLPGAAPLSVVYAWYFGFWHAMVLISFASTLGATLAFLLSRYLLRDVIQNRFGERLVAFNANLEKEGAFYLFTLRLIPAVPFFVINLVMGLTPMKTRTFWWVSQVGMLAGTAVFVWAGSSVPSLEELAKKGISGLITPQLFAAFVLLGTFPLIVRKLVEYVRSNRSQPI